MIRMEDLLKAGQIHKPHGVKGELTFSFQVDVTDAGESDWLMVMVGGLPVPFRAEHIRVKTPGEAILKLEGVDSAFEAAAFSGSEVYVSREKYLAEDAGEVLLSMLIGYSIVDEDAGEIGLISEIDESTENILFVVEGAAGQVLIPVVEEFILEIDHDRQRIATCLPDGLLGL